MVYTSTPYNSKGYSFLRLNNDPLWYSSLSDVTEAFLYDPHNVPTSKDHLEAEVPEAHYTVPLARQGLQWRVPTAQLFLGAQWST